MELFRMAGKALMIAALLVFLYDAVSGWFVNATFGVRSLAEWWKSVNMASLSNARVFLSAHLGSGRTDKLFDAPAAIIVFLPGLFLYLFYRLIFALKGGRGGGGGGFKYRSRD